MPITAPPAVHRPVPAAVPSYQRPVMRAFDHHRPATTVDLGAYRPLPSESSEDDACVQREMPQRHTVSYEPVSGLAAAVGPRPPVAKQSIFAGGHALLVASLAGALLFVVSTDFGRHVRHAETMSRGIDRMLVSLGFGINEISLTGHQHTADQEVFRALGLGQATLLTLDVDAARRRVESLPWIETATLVRVFPDKLRVELHERKPAAVWLDGDRIVLVDAEGRVLSSVAKSNVPSDLPKIAGPGAPIAAAELQNALVRFPGVASRVRLARRISDRRWDIELTNGTVVKLAAGPTAASLERFVNLEEETRWLDHAGQVVDLTVPRSIAVSTPAPLGSAARTHAPGRSARPL